MRKTLVLSLLVLAAIGAFVFAQPAAAASVAPVFVAGNPSCADLGYDFETKFEPVGASGSFTFPGTSLTVSYTSTGTGTINWTSNFGIDAVIMKGGSNANVYYYNPESLGDTNLSTPINPTNGQPFGTSHISFCYDFELTASKTANATFTRTYTWTIDKSVAPDSHTGFAGDDFASDYDVVVDQTVNDTDFGVNGTITVNNPTPFTVGFSVSDSVGGTNATVNCPTLSLAPGASTVCTYSASLGGAVNGVNTATVTSTNSDVGGATATAPYTFGDPTTVVGEPTVNVTDSVEGSLGEASSDTTFEYVGEFECPTDPAEYTDGVYTETVPNTATIVETEQEDSASVDLTCYIPTISKTAVTTFNRDWTWTIVKTGDQTDLTLSVGQKFLVNYDVTVDATSVDSDFAVSGTITIANPATIALELDDVTDELANGALVEVTCPLDLTVPAGGTLECAYTSSLPDATATENTATATFNDVSVSDTVDVTFDNTPDVETDECIDVVDDQYGALGTVCAGDAPKTFEYSMYVGPYDVCGEYSFVNVASFTTNDNKETGSDDHTVDVNVPCAVGCTLTPGYWKTHSEKGPAPYDDTWAQLPNGANTTFYLSGVSYYTVLWTPPKGNAYYILAHAYIAAYMNTLNGASTTPEVNAALMYADSFFDNYTPTSSLSKAKRNEVISMAAILDKYNNGLIGPGHCSE